MTFFAPLIPNEARRAQMELRSRCKSDKEFADKIWRERMKERLDNLPFRMCRTRSSGAWPHVRDADRPRGNVQPIRKAKP